MKEQRDYLQDITEIRSMMERSSKFMSLSGLSGIMAGIYALAGAWIAYDVYAFNPSEIAPDPSLSAGAPSTLPQIFIVALVVLVLAVGTAIFLSHRKAKRRGEKIWNATSRQLLINMAVPLLAGGIVIMVLLLKGFVGLMAPFTLLFYGLAIYNASKFTFNEMKFMGLIQIALGLVGTMFIGYGLLLWAIGFGVVHIAYGMYMHVKHER